MAIKQAIVWFQHLPSTGTCTRNKPSPGAECSARSLGIIASPNSLGASPQQRVDSPENSHESQPFSTVNPEDQHKFIPGSWHTHGKEYTARAWAEHPMTYVDHRVHGRNSHPGCSAANSSSQPTVPLTLCTLSLVSAMNCIARRRTCFDILKTTNPGGAEVYDTHLL